MEGQTNEVNAVQFISSSLLAVGKHIDGTIDIWDLNKSSIVQKLRGHKISVYSLKLISNELLASGSYDASIKLWRLNDFSLVQTLNGHKQTVQCLELISSDVLASGSNDNTIKIWNLKDYSIVKTLEGHTNDVLCLKLLSSKFLASGSEDKTIKIWDVQNFNCLKTIEGHSGSIYCLELVSSDLMASGSFDSIKIWRFQESSSSVLITFECIKTIEKSLAISLRLISKDLFASSGNYSGSIQIWSIKYFSCLQTLQGHTNSVWSLDSIGSN